MNLINCKICNRQELVKVISFEKYPKSISHLYKLHSEATSDFTSIHFNQCLNCNHIQIGNDLPPSFYSDYIMTVSHSNKMLEFQIKQAQFFVDNFSLQGKKILEVGCGDGNFSKLLEELNCKVFCNEPSKPFRELAAKKGLKVDDLYINKDYNNPNGPFDGIVSREVMEHVPDPIDFLVSIRKSLKPNGVVLIEVPNFEKTISELRYYDMFPDHLSYFSKESLTCAMLISGFKDINIHYGMDNEFIYATAKNYSLNIESLITTYTELNSSFLITCKNYKNVVIWGAGGKGISFLGSLNELSNIKYVVDSDKFKQDKFLPSSGLKVHSPEFFFSDDMVDLLIITNLAYTDEILSILKTNNFNKTVKVLSKREIVDIVNY